MAAGSSAEREGQRAREAERRLERKARNAANAARNWEQGAEGERLTAEVLGALEGYGWCVIHDRRAPDGGNIDHIVVGPPGVAVVDTKNWTDPVTITSDRRLVFSKYDKTGELDRLSGLVEHVRALLASDGVQVSVRGYLVLVGAVDREREGTDIGDLRVIGVERLVARLSKSRKNLGSDLVDAVAATVAASLPPMDGDAAEASAADADRRSDVPSPVFEKAHRFYYLHRWKKGGNDRMYLKDRQGATLGWTDLTTGAVEMHCGPEDAPFARTLLAAADPEGVKLAAGDVPKVPTRLFGGRLLSRVARLHTSLLVGQEWSAYGKQRLYGTLIDPAITNFDLGWIDLKNGELHPSLNGPLHKDRREPAQYLRYLHHYWLKSKG